MVERGIDARRFTILLGAVVTAASVLVVGIAWSLPIPPPSGPTHLRIESVVVAPTAPGPTDLVIVTARVTGVRSPAIVLGYAVQFGATVPETPRMDSRGNGEFARTIGPFPDGAEVWLLVAAFVGSFGPVVSEPRTFHVGAPTPDAGTGLRIHRVFLSPDPPQPFSPTSVGADVTSTAPIQSVSLSYVAMGLDGLGGGIVEMTGGNITFWATPPVGIGPDDRVVAAYRVAARDEGGGRAVSAVGTFEIERVRPVP